MSTALIAGSTGLVGSALLKVLLASDRYDSVLALVRRQLDIQYPKLIPLATDFDALTEVPPCDDVFCALGTTIKKAGSQPAFRHVDFEIPLAIARAARNRGARQFLLVSSVGADSRSSNFYLRTKGELEDALRALDFPTLHIFRPSLLLGHRAESRPGEKIGVTLAPLFSPLLIGSLRRYRPIPATDVARAMAAAAVNNAPGVHLHHFDEINASRATP